MSTHRPTKDIGQKAEEKALQYLLNKGFVLRERNYRCKRSEIDLILVESKTLVFVEVKYRSTSQFGHPEEFVSDNQKRSILQGAEHYITELDWQDPIRFDIIAIDAQFNITHFEDAFY
ncbi:YraN family protein [Reichenbachiella sp.]|uniref:YraN family protein n=1 Tax=Reichenbachiella sp. TaxID=2184521 RepID=UPI003BB15BAF